MKTIPSDLIPALVGAGFANASGLKRGEDISAPPGYIVAVVCKCSYEQIQLTQIALRDRSIMAGQCPKCRIIHWSDWVSKEVRSRPIVR